MCEETENQETETAEVAAEVQEKPAKPQKKVSFARAAGRAAGAGVAIPTAALVFLVAAFAGVPASTAVTRSLLVGLCMWFGVGLAIRLIFSFVIHDWRQRMTPQVADEDMTS